MSRRAHNFMNGQANDKSNAISRSAPSPCWIAGCGIKGDLGQHEIALKLEMIGDALVMLFSREILYMEYPEIPKRYYCKIQAIMVSNKVLNHLAEQIEMPPQDISWKGRARSFETHLGRLYLEQGIEPAKKLFASLIMKHLDLIAMSAAWHPAQKLHAIYR